jgi:hypothetical protein
MAAVLLADRGLANPELVIPKLKMALPFLV